MTENPESNSLSLVQSAQCINGMSRALCNNNIPFVNPMTVLNQLHELSGVVQQPQPSLHPTTNNFTRVPAKHLDTQANQLKFLPCNYKSGQFLPPVHNKPTCKEERLREKDGGFIQDWNSSTVPTASDSEHSDASKSTPTDSMIFDGRLITNVPDNILDCPFLTEEDKLKIRKGLAERRSNARDINQDAFANDLSRTKIPSLLDLEVAPPGLTLIRNDAAASYDAATVNFDESTVHERQLIDYHSDALENLQNISRGDNRHIEWQPGGWRKILSLDVPLGAFNKQQNVKLPPPNVIHRMPVKMNYPHMPVNNSHSPNDFVHANVINNLNAIHNPLNTIGQPLACHNLADVSGLSLVDRQRLISALNMAPLAYHQQANSLISIPPQAQILNVLQPSSPRQMKGLKRKHRYSLAPSPYRSKVHCSSPSVFSSRKRYRDLDAPSFNDETNDDRRIVSYADFDATDDKEIEDDKKKQDMDFEASLMAELDRIKKHSSSNDGLVCTFKTNTTSYSDDIHENGNNKYNGDMAWQTYDKQALSHQFHSVKPAVTEINYHPHTDNSVNHTFDGTEMNKNDLNFHGSTLVNNANMDCLIAGIDANKVSCDFVSREAERLPLSGQNHSFNNVNFKQLGLEGVQFLRMEHLTNQNCNVTRLGERLSIHENDAAQVVTENAEGLRTQLLQTGDSVESQLRKSESLISSGENRECENDLIKKQQENIHEDGTIKPLSAEMILEYLTRSSKTSVGDDSKSIRIAIKSDNRKFQGIHDEKELKAIHKVLATEHNILVRRPHRLFEYDVNKEFKTHLQEEYRSCSLPVAKPLSNFTSTLTVINELVSYYLCEPDENVKIVFNPVLLKKGALFNNENANKILKKPWINKEIQALVARHKELHQCTESGEISLPELNEYKRIRARIKELIKLAKAQYAKKMKEKDELMQASMQQKNAFIHNGFNPLTSYVNSFDYNMMNARFNDNLTKNVPSINTNVANSNVIDDSRISNHMVNVPLSVSSVPPNFSLLMSKFAMNKSPLQLLQPMDVNNDAHYNAGHANMSATKLMPSLIPFDFRSIPPPNYHPFPAQYKSALGSQPMVASVENIERMNEISTCETPVTTVPSFSYTHIPPPPLPMFNRRPSDIRTYFNPDIPPPTNFTVPPPDINKILNTDIGNVLRSLSNAKKELSATVKAISVNENKPINSLPPPSFFANLPPPRLGTIPTFLSCPPPAMPQASPRCSVPVSFTQPLETVIQSSADANIITAEIPCKQLKLSVQNDEDTSSQNSRSLVSLLSESLENNSSAARFVNKWKKHSDVAMQNIIKDAQEFVKARVKAAKAQEAAKVAKTDDSSSAKNSVPKPFPIKIELEYHKTLNNTSSNTATTNCTEVDKPDGQNQFVDNNNQFPVTLQHSDKVSNALQKPLHLDHQTFCSDDTLRTRIFL